jgi:hypothetical protein
MRLTAGLAVSITLLTLGACATGGGTERAPLTEAEVQARYPRMDAVFIRKCEKDGDGLYGGGEMGCVRGIHQQMYIAD